LLVRLQVELVLLQQEEAVLQASVVVEVLVLVLFYFP
jgi:hypothetical protein